MRTPVNVAVVGGANVARELVRTFDELPQALLRWVCDDAQPRTLHPGPQLPLRTADVDDVLEDEEVDAVVFATTAVAAHGRARAALEAEKHVFVAGPLAYTAAEVNTLLEIASRRSRRLWSHLPGVQRPAARQLHALVGQGALGELFYLHSRGYVERHDDAVDLLWGPGVEAVALVLDLLDDEPIAVLARAESYLGRATPDVVAAELRFATGITAHVYLSCLEGETLDRFSVVGSDATAVLVSALDRRELVVYPSAPAGAPTGLPLGAGAKIAYRVPPDESTKLACARFIGAVRSTGELEGARAAVSAVAVVEALERSAEQPAAAEEVAPVSATGGLNVIELRQR